MNTIITIGRQYGSGGREIGEKLAKRLNIPFYDKELLSRAAKESGFCQEMIENHDERPTSSFLYNLVMDTYSFGYNSSSFVDMPISHKIFLAQFDTIKKIADEGACVIVGRCAGQILKGHPMCLDVFICADMEDRIQRIAKRYDLSEKKAADKIKRVDRERKYYYESHTGLEWGSISSHQMLLNVSRFGIEGTADLLETVYRGQS